MKTAAATRQPKPAVPEPVRRIYSDLLATYRREMQTRHPDADKVSVRVAKRLSTVWFHGMKAWGWQARLEVKADGYRTTVVSLCVPPDYFRTRAWIG